MSTVNGREFEREELPLPRYDKGKYTALPQWKPIDMAPKDGTVIKVRTQFLGREIIQEASWRSVEKPTLFCPRTGEMYASPSAVEGWHYEHSDYLIPGAILEWMDA